MIVLHLVHNHGAASKLLRYMIDTDSVCLVITAFGSIKQTREKNGHNLNNINHRTHNCRKLTPKQRPPADSVSLQSVSDVIELFSHQVRQPHVEED